MGENPTETKPVPLPLGQPQNPSWSCLVLNLDLCGDRLANTLLKHGRARISLPIPMLKNCEVAIDVSLTSVYYRINKVATCKQHVWGRRKMHLGF